MDRLPMHFLMLILAGWVDRHQQEAIEYLQEENREVGRVLKHYDLRLARIPVPGLRRVDLCGPRLRGLGLRTGVLVAQLLLATSAFALDGGSLRLTTYNGWEAFEVISAGEDPAGDGFTHSMLAQFDGAGAWLVDPATLRVQVNHEVFDTLISEVNIDLAALKTAISNMISGGTTGGVTFVVSARQAYDSWSDDGGATFLPTSDTSNTSFNRFCSGQAYAAHTFGIDRGFVDEIYITGEEFGGTDRLFAIDSVNRDFYQLSGTAGSAPGGIGGIPFDSYENVALMDTGETDHVALLLSPDGGTRTMRLYIGEKGKDSSGLASGSFLARNGLAYGSWYYLIASYPGIGNTNNGSFSTSASGSLTSDKIEDVDTSPGHPSWAVMGDQTSGLFTFDFDFVFGTGFDSGASSFTITMISTTRNGVGFLGQPDNVDWTDATTLGAATYPNGLIFVNEDNASGEIWHMLPDGSDRVRIASTTVSGESTGIFDISVMVGYSPGSILITNNQGTPASMSVLINPDATALKVVLEAVIDIRPGSDINPVKLMSRGVTPVAILGSDTFDVADVDVSTLAFGPEGAALAHKNGPHVKHANRDRVGYLLAHFPTEEAGIAFGDAEACVTGELLDGTAFEGCDDIATEPHCGVGFELTLLLPPLTWVYRRRRRSSRTSRRRAIARRSAAASNGLIS